MMKVKLRIVWLCAVLIICGLMVREDIYRKIKANLRIFEETK